MLIACKITFWSLNPNPFWIFHNVSMEFLMRLFHNLRWLFIGSILNCYLFFPNRSGCSSPDQGWQFHSELGRIGWYSCFRLYRCFICICWKSYKDSGQNWFYEHRYAFDFGCWCTDWSNFQWTEWYGRVSWICPKIKKQKKTKQVHFSSDGKSNGIGDAKKTAPKRCSDDGSSNTLLVRPKRKAAPSTLKEPSLAKKMRRWKTKYTTCF